MAELEQKVRLDKWLWAARFFKTRALAVEAIKGGHVHLNGSRPKASRTVQTGDRLEISKGQEHFTLTIDGLSDKRGPASVARDLYTESADSIERRQHLAEQRRLEAAGRSGGPSRRPDKRQRRHIVRFKGG